MTETEVRAVAQEAADRAVAKLFERLGVDAADTDDVYRLRQDLEFLSQARTGTRHGAKALASAILAALGMAVWLGMQALLGRS